MAALVQHVFEYQPYRLKSGKLGKSSVFVGAWPYCPVERCERCGKLGSPTWVRKWYMTPWSRFKSELAPEEMDGVLCLGCMNRERVHWRAFMILRENRTLIGKIKKEIGRVNAQNGR